MDKRFNIHDWQAKQRLNEQDVFGSAGTDKRSGQVIGDILQLIKSTGIDPEDVIEAINQDFNREAPDTTRYGSEMPGPGRASGMEEMNTTGTGTSISTGNSPAYATPFAFKKKKKK